VEKTSAQAMSKPNRVPAAAAVVTVPGPIKAAATSAPGPNSFNLSTNLIGNLPGRMKPNILGSSQFFTLSGSMPMFLFNG
jgi:hypothetical protein